MQFHRDEQSVLLVSSTMELPFLLTSTLVVFLFMAFKGCRSIIKNRNSKLPPGPWKLPLIGHLHHLLGLPHRKLRDLAMIHGPLMYLQLGEVPTIVVSSPRLAKEMMKTHDLVFADRGALLAAKILSYDYKGIVFGAYGSYWRQMKKIAIIELLSAKRVSSFWFIREEEVANLIDKTFSMAGSSLNLSHEFTSLTNDITCRATFGNKYKEKAFLSLMDVVVDSSGGFDISDVYPSIKFLQLISGLKIKLEKFQGKMDIFLDDIINEHRVKRTRNKANKVEMEEDLVDVLIRIQEDNGLDFRLENNDIKVIILEMFFAGTETSSTTLDWAMAEMMRNPRVMEKAQSEVRQVFKGKTRVCQSDVNELNYLRLVIKETLRVHPPLALLLPRESRERCEIDGYEIPKGTKVIVNAWAIGRDPDHWSDAETFNPERFRDVCIDYKGTNFEYIPFGAGRRICPGILFGAANMELPLAQLLYYFDWKLPNGLKPEELEMNERFGAAVRRKSNLYVIPKPYHF